MHLLRLVAILACSALTAVAAAQNGDVIIEVEQFGVGNAIRAGEIAAMRVELTSQLAQPTPVWVQWEVPNADGDIGEYGRSLTISPGSGPASRVWLYAPLSPDTDGSTVWSVRVFEESDGRRGRKLSDARVLASTTKRGPALVATFSNTLIGLVGQRRAGIESIAVGDTALQRPPAAHEQPRIIGGIDPAELPDRWEGLRQFEALVWTNALPSELRDDPARALANWVARGGHLVISLPAAGNPWSLGKPGSIPREIEQLLPGFENQSEPRRDDATRLSEILPVLAKDGFVLTADFELAVRVFKDDRDGFDVIDNHFEPLIKLPDGRTVVVQRTFGFGRVTVVGIDLDNRLQSIGLPQGDAFWNRILGRRADTPTAGEWSQVQKADLNISSAFGITEQQVGKGELFTDEISQSQQAGIGLMLALVIFIAYWLVAGPGGYLVLKSYRQVKHSWLAFAGASIVFTGIAWLVVTFVPDRQLKVQHFTVLDHLARPDSDTRGPEEPQFQRAASWFSIYNPAYGETVLSLESAPRQRDLLVPWFPILANTLPFPNVDRFTVDVGRSAASLSLPSRATETQLYAHWMGGVDPDWGGMIRSDPADPVRVEVVDGREDLKGSIIHALPGNLRDVRIFWIHNRRYPMRSYTRSENRLPLPWVDYRESGRLLNNGRFWSPGEAWAANTPLSIDEQPTRSVLDINIDETYNTGRRRGQFSLSERERRDHVEMLSIYQQLSPPAYYKQSPSEDAPDENIVFNRMSGRELDLSPWFSRPCLIIIGYLDDTRIPIPLRIGDDTEAPTSTGKTVIRWIYPLPLEEDIAFPPLVTSNNDG